MSSDIFYHSSPLPYAPLPPPGSISHLFLAISQPLLIIEVSHYGHYFHWLAIFFIFTCQISALCLAITPILLCHLRGHQSLYNRCAAVS